jgi:DinB superfamily
MSETVEQYIARLMGLVSGHDPMVVMAETPGHLRTLVTGATPRELAWKPSPTRWSVVQILAHLADAEVVGAWRFRSVLAADGLPLQAYDQNAWASAFRYENTDPMASLTLFEALRHSTLHVLRSVDPGRLEHAGLHEERGRESISQLVRMYAGHDLNHRSQVEGLIVGARQSLTADP